MEKQSTYLEKAIKDGYAFISGNGNKEKITYVTSDNHSENYSDPEEKVRAEFWAELIYKYEYPVNKIKIEVVVPDRLPTDRADIVVFSDDECKRPYIVVECKKDGVTDAEFSQAIEQGVGNATWVKLRAEYVVIVAGATRRVLDVSDKYGAFEREENILADLPKTYGKPQEYRFYKGSDNDIKPVSREDLIIAIKKCHQTLWGGGRMSPPTAFGELCKLIFVKISDEQKPRKKGEPYQFQIKTHESSAKLAGRINALYDEQKKRDPEVFTESIKVDDRVLRTVVSHLESINLNKTDLDVKGVAFEQFMDGFFKGDFGQYFTPRPIIEFIVKMLKPENDWDVLDPACGSGGFLLHALDYMRNQAKEYYEEKSNDYYKYWHDFASQHLFGIEINDEIARVAKMNMIVHDDGHTNVISHDALADISKMYEHNHGFKQGKFDLILTNPPFGATINLAESPYLANYELGNKVDAKGKAKPRKNQSSEVLFIERIWEFLKEGMGKAAIILPDGILTNSTSQYVRDFILEKFQLLAVVSLPQCAFAHFGAGVKASVIFVRKRSKKEVPDENEAIFMAAPELIGYDATGRETESQLGEIIKKFEEFQKDAIMRENRSIEEKFLWNKATGEVGKVVKLKQIDGVIDAKRYMVKQYHFTFTLSDICDIVKEKVNVLLYDTEIVDWIRIDDLSNDPIDIEVVRTQPANEMDGSFFVVQEGDILVARLGPTILNQKIVMVRQIERTTLASAEFLVLRCKNGYNAEAVMAVLKTEYYKKLMYSHARGSTPSRYRLNREDALNLSFPDITMLQEKIAKQAVDVRNKVKALRQEAEKEWAEAKVQFERELLGE